MKHKFKSILLAATISGLASFSQPLVHEVAEQGKMYVGIGYAASESGNVSNKQNAGIGVWGVAHAAINGAVYGAVFGAGVGAAAGIVIGL